MSTEQPEPQPNSADLIDVLADYCAARGASETKAQMVDELTAMSEEELRVFADLVMAEVAQYATKSKIALPRRFGR